MSWPCPEPNGRFPARVAKWEQLDAPTKKEQLAHMRAQVEEGTLIIRQMSEDELEAQRRRRQERLAEP